MDKAHSETGTTKSHRHTIVVPALPDWGAYEARTKVEDLGVLKAQGWRTPHEFCRDRTELPTIRQRMARDKSLEQRKVRAVFEGRIRELNIYRPKPCPKPRTR